MDTAKVSINIDRKTLRRLDFLVRERKFRDRNQAIQDAIEEKLARLERSRLAEECAKLDPIAEQLMADEGLSEEELCQWPKY